MSPVLHSGERFRRNEVSLSYLRAPPSIVDGFCSAKRWPRNAGDMGGMRACVRERASEGSNIHILRSADYFNITFNNKYKSAADEVFGLQRDFENE